MKKLKFGWNALGSLALLVLVGWSLGYQAGAEDYCLAIRGNGELEPSHWGAISHVVELLGLPRVQSGGSSGSVTMFWLEAISQNQAVTEAPTPAAQRARAALLIKSLQGVYDYVLTTDSYKNLMALYGDLKDLKLEKSNASLSDAQALLTKLIDALNSNNPKAVAEQIKRLKSAYDTLSRVGFINSAVLKAVNNLLDSQAQNGLTLHQVEQARFLVTEYMQSLKAFDSFDAAEDDNLFFRLGVVDFDKLALELGRVADFYASPEMSKTWKQFANLCAEKATGKLWKDLPEQCHTELAQMARAYFPAHMDSKEFVEKPVGSGIASLPSISVFTEDAADDVAAAFGDYHQQMSSKFGRTFYLHHPENLKFGYWGPEIILEHIDSRLPKSTDEKSFRFRSLGSASWRTILGLSPAEPGLSPIKPFTDSKGKALYSGGGWSDLHPVLLLKAASEKCDKVVYVTRRTGDAIFAQGVAKRLFSGPPNGPDQFGRDWNYLRTTTPKESEASTLANNIGDPNDLSSLWSRLYNIANPQSSFRQALSKADLVVCTDWNSKEPFGGAGIQPMITDAYLAPFYVNPHGTMTGLGLPNGVDPAKTTNGIPDFVGCF